MNKKPNLLKKYLSISIGLAIALLLSELLIRIFIFGSAAFSYKKTNSFGILDNSDIIRYSKIEGIKYELKPNLNTYYKLFPFKTNNIGFRDVDYKIEKDKNTIRIAVIGDSFTMGTGVSYENLYSTQLKKLLRQHYNKEIEVLNFGVSGYGLTEYYQIYNHYVKNYNPDLVIIGFCASNDQYILGEDYNLDNFTIKPKKNVFWDSYLKKFIQNRLRKKPEQLIYNKKQLNYIDKEFKKINDSIKNSKVIVFYMDLAYDNIRINYIHDLAIKNNIMFVESSSYFKDKILNSYLFNELDSHPNGEANKIFASKLEKFLIKEFDFLFLNNEY